MEFILADERQLTCVVLGGRVEPVPPTCDVGADGGGSYTAVALTFRTQ